LPKSLKGSGSIEVLNVGLREALQMGLTEDQDVVKAFAADTAQAALADCI
jgi:hypothetical protein